MENSNPFLKTKIVFSKTYKQFICNDFNCTEQRRILLQMDNLFEKYNSAKLKSHKNSIENNSIVFESTVDWDFEVYKMKRCILQNIPYICNYEIKPILTKHANQVFLLAMIYGNIDIVRYFINLININSSIFGSRKFPSYFLLACSCQSHILELFKRGSVGYHIAWNGLTPHLLCSFKPYSLARVADLDFLTYQEFSYLNRFRGIKLRKADKVYPIFILDFLLMKGFNVQIKELLERVPESGYLSRLSFIVQNRESSILILTRYGFRIDQEFNGNTPLHFSALNGDLYMLTYLMYAGFPILQNSDGLFSNEIGDKNFIEKANKIFKFCVGVPIIDSKFDGYRRIFCVDSFIENIHAFINILKPNSETYNKYLYGLKCLDFNEQNRILRANRFTVISVFALTKYPVTVERDIGKLKNFYVPELKISKKEVTKKYMETFYD